MNLRNWAKVGAAGVDNVARIADQLVHQLCASRGHGQTRRACAFELRPPPMFVHGDRGSQAHRCSRRAVPPPPVPSRSAHRDEPTQHGFDRGRVGRTHVGHQGEAAATHIAIVHVGKGRSVKRSPCRLRERANATRLRRCRGRCRPNWRAAAFVRQRAYWTRLSSGPPEPGRRRMLSPWDPH